MTNRENTPTTLGDKYYMQLGWHVLRKDYRKRGAHGVAQGGWTPKPVGQVSIQKGEIDICWNGLHYSKRLQDAACYAPRHEDVIVCRVVVFDCRDNPRGRWSAQKGVARGRLILWKVQIPAHRNLYRTDTNERVPSKPRRHESTEKTVTQQAKKEGVWKPDPETDKEWDALQDKFERAFYKAGGK